MNPIYVEATIEHVDNDKYGKDVGKFALIREKDPGAQCLLVSAVGFSKPVRERAEQSRFRALTYDELFTQFERFEPYVRAITNDPTDARGLAKLARVYEEPWFEDKAGKEVATKYLAEWRNLNTDEDRWLIVVGEYGTGKTALTKVLQYRWAAEHHNNPTLPLPLRIELRDFNHQFDARGLLHHFLDRNDLGHLSIEFVLSLIRKGRIVLLLDGYDEMAQYMTARERRVCLEALAHLASDGAKGLLTSRPNYFSEAEELHVFEMLYSTVPAEGRLAALTQEVSQKEKQIDNLLKSHILDRHERALRDLTAEQTERLIGRVLEHDQAGKAVVLNILQRVFRQKDDGSAVSLSGKPVIISYLIDVVEELKQSGLSGVAPISEWGVYELIIDNLMGRDYKAGSMILPERRRRFLQILSARLSRRETPIVSEDEFRDIVRQDFKNELRPALEGDQKSKLDQLTDDLRRSSTLTRTSDGNRLGWRFSHNSLREFLLTQYLITGLVQDKLVPDPLPVSDTMRLFVASHGASDVRKWLDKLATLWPNRQGNARAWGQLVELLWGAGCRIHEAEADPVRSCLRSITGETLSLSAVRLERVRFGNSERPADLSGANFAQSEFLDCNFTGVGLQKTTFTDAICENVSFADTDIRNADFGGSWLIEVDFSDADVRGSRFHKLVDPPVILVDDPRASASKLRLEGNEAIGYLRFAGAQTDDVPPYFVYRHDSRFSIVEKICRKISEQGKRQVLGLVQKGAAHQDPDFARAFLQHLIAKGLAEPFMQYRLIGATPQGRSVLTRFLERNELSPELEEFCREHMK